MDTSVHTIAPTTRVATRVPVERDSYWVVTTEHAQVRTVCTLDNVHTGLHYSVSTITLYQLRK